MKAENLQKEIENLIAYACERKLIDLYDCTWTANQLSFLFSFTPETDWNFTSHNNPVLFPEILHGLTCIAIKKNIIQNTVMQKEQFENRIMNILTPRPSEVIDQFQHFYKTAPSCSTDYFFSLEKDCYYIKTDAISKNRQWKYQSQYGVMDITINLSKPEISKEEILAQKRNPSSSYPSDLLCHDNEGFAGSLTHPSRMTLRQIPMQMNKEIWYMQYSPYAYYNEHCIVLTEKARPMKIDHNTFVSLLDFLDLFPHYFIGSNSDLPVCGGSILSHEHFQGGRYVFAMMKAPVQKDIRLKKYPSLKAGILKWPLSVIKLEARDRDLLIHACTDILKSWQTYNNEKLMIFSHRNNQLLSTLTPIACFQNGSYVIYLVFRNSLTTDDYPLGYFHAHPEHHHIKKENIGLIEVMGLAILPPRLLKEMKAVKEAVLSNSDLTHNPLALLHAEWVNEWLDDYPEITEENIDCILKNEIGKVFVKVLENCALFPHTAEGENAFLHFLENI